MLHETQRNSLFYDTECMPPLPSVYIYSMSASIELGVLFLYCLLVPGTPVKIHIASILKKVPNFKNSAQEKKKERKKAIHRHRPTDILSNTMHQLLGSRKRGQDMANTKLQLQVTNNGRYMCDKKMQCMTIYKININKKMCKLICNL